MKKLLIFSVWAFSILPLLCWSKDIKYKLSDIPKELKTNAKAVIRLNETEFDIKSPSHATEKVTLAITILNENGIKLATFMRVYNKFMKINNIKAAVYDQNGNRIKRIKADDILDLSAISGFSVYEDTRRKLIDPKTRTFPFTVEYNYEVNYSGLLSYPTWMPYLDYGVSVQDSKFTVRVPQTMQLRFKECNLPMKGTSTEEDDQKTYSWSVKNLKTLKEEDFSFSPPVNSMPIVYIAPTDFEIDDYPGNLSSWKNYGEWVTKLYNGLDVLPPEEKEKIDQLVENTKDEKTKIALIYKFLQNNTRYVSIQAGIGGWKPLDASTVDRLAYGDCKALSNYMHSLLKAVGIKSNLVLIKGGSDELPLISDFPSNQFNHAILCVPMAQDTIWLECTSQHLPCGYTGSFTDDRDALLIDGDKSHLVHTKRFSAKENIQIKTAVVNLSSDGKGKASIKNTYSGVYFDHIQRNILSDETDKKKLISNQLSIPNFTLGKFSYDVEEKQIPIAKENIEIALDGYGTRMGNNIFIQPNLLDKIEDLPRQTTKRQAEVVIRRSFTKLDTIIYEIPPKYVVSGQPLKISISSKFGEYSANTEIDGKQLKYTRCLKMKEGIFPPEEYAELVHFFDQIYSADDTKIALRAM